MTNLDCTSLRLLQTWPGSRHSHELRCWLQRTSWPSLPALPLCCCFVSAFIAGPAWFSSKALDHWTILYWTTEPSLNFQPNIDRNQSSHAADWGLCSCLWTSSPRKDWAEWWKVSVLVPLTQTCPISDFCGRCVRLSDVGSLPIDTTWLSTNEFKAQRHHGRPWAKLYNIVWCMRQLCNQSEVEAVFHWPGNFSRCMFFGKVQDDGNGDDGDAEVLVWFQCTLMKQRSPTWCEMDSKSVRQFDNSFPFPSMYNQYTYVYVLIHKYTVYDYTYYMII